MRVHRDVYYFNTYQEARAYAQEHNYPTTRIIAYLRGYAIQLGISGAYVGPSTTERNPA